MATLGPVSRDETVLRGLVRAGVDLFRLNLSHGTQEQHRETLRRVRRVAAEEGCHLPVVLDLMGPRYRLGTIPDEPRLLKVHQEVVLGPEAHDVDLPVDPEIIEHLKADERVLIDGGLIELRILSKHGDRVRAKVINGGPVKTRKGINLPDSDLPFEVSEKDRADIVFAVAEGADYLAASYVGEAAHIEAVRAVVSAAGGRIPIIAKIERKTAIEKLDEITDAADGMMVARGDLGVEVPLYTVPVLQKRIVAAGRLSGKPVIVATQMLESMVEQPRPTRAEATDVANAVFDGADALMLSGRRRRGSTPCWWSRRWRRSSRRPRTTPARATAGRPCQPLGHVHARRSFALDPDHPSPADPSDPAETADRRRAVARHPRHRLRRRRARRRADRRPPHRGVQPERLHRPPGGALPAAVADHGLHPRRPGGAPAPARLGGAPVRRRVPGGEPRGHRHGGRARAARRQAGRARRQDHHPDGAPGARAPADQPDAGPPHPAGRVTRRRKQAAGARRRGRRRRRPRPGGLADAFWIEPRLLLFRDDVRIALPAPRLRIAHLSDLHIRGDSQPLLHRLLGEVAAARPDVIVISGDLIHDVPDPARLARHRGDDGGVRRRPAPDRAGLRRPGAQRAPGGADRPRSQAAGLDWLSNEGRRIGPAGPGDAGYLLLGLNTQVGLDEWAWRWPSPFQPFTVDGARLYGASRETPYRSFFSHYDPAPASLTDLNGGPLAWSGYETTCEARIDDPAASVGLAVHSRYVAGDDRLILFTPRPVALEPGAAPSPSTPTARRSPAGTTPACGRSPDAGTG